MKFVLIAFLLSSGFILSQSAIADERSAQPTQLALEAEQQQVNAVPVRPLKEFNDQNPLARADVSHPEPINPEPLSKDQVLVDLSVRLAERTEGS